MHLHASALDALVFAAYLVVVGFIFRWIAARWPESAIGKALAFVF